MQRYLKSKDKHMSEHTFANRYKTCEPELSSLYLELYPGREAAYGQFLRMLEGAWTARPDTMKRLDRERLEHPGWYKERNLLGMQLYVGAFAGTLNGVRVYEWTPGFCHCKMCVVDDEAAVCGTINLDYRSLYHHFENACLYINCQAVLDTKADFERTFSECEEVTEKYNTGRDRFMKIKQLLLRLFSPLL